MSKGEYWLVASQEDMYWVKAGAFPSSSLDLVSLCRRDTSKERGCCTLPSSGAVEVRSVTGKGAATNGDSDERQMVLMGKQSIIYEREGKKKKKKHYWKLASSNIRGEALFKVCSGFPTRQLEFLPQRLEVLQRVVRQRH